MYIVTTEQMQAAEKAADASGLTYDQMMESAGHAVAKAIEAQFDLAGVRVLVLVGPGNNGGDGLVVARYLAQMGAIVSVYVWKRKTGGDKNWTLLEATSVEQILSDEKNSQARLDHLLGNSGIIIDALLGTGVSRPIAGSLAELLDKTKAAVDTSRASHSSGLVDPAYPAQQQNGFSPVVVALDVPSGLNSDTGEVDRHTLAADLTVTLAAVKCGHILMPGPTVVGQLIVGDIGIGPDHYPAEMTPVEMATATKVARLLPSRPVGAHKGTFGTALLVAGSLSYTGAAILAGQAATRSGAGLVTLACPRSIHPILASRLSDATYLPLMDKAGSLTAAAVPALRERAAAAKVKALLIGPGLGQAESTGEFLSELLKETDDLPPLIMDADALNLLARQDEWWQLLPPNCILTPHPGEMSRLTGRSIQEVEANRLEFAPEMAAKWKQVLLLKGAHTIIAAPGGRTVVLPFANPALAKAGSGDVLAGTIAGLLAQGLGSLEAGVAGGYMHGLTGEIARDNLGVTAVTAGDLVGFLPVAFRAVLGE